MLHNQPWYVKRQMTRSRLVNPSPRRPYAWRISRWWPDFVFTRPAYRFTTAGSATPSCPPRSPAPRPAHRADPAGTSRASARSPAGARSRPSSGRRAAGPPASGPHRHRPHRRDEPGCSHPQRPNRYKIMRRPASPTSERRRAVIYPPVEPVDDGSEVRRYQTSRLPGSRSAAITLRSLAVILSSG